MKLIRRSVNGAVVCAIALAMVSSLAAQTATEGIAKVVNIKGRARAMTTESPTWQPLRVGQVLKAGTTIQTAADSYVDVVLNNPNATLAASTEINAMAVMSPIPVVSSGGGAAKAEQDALRIFENTVLGIDKLSVTQTGADKVTDTQLDLKYGRILGTVKKLSAASRYEVKIPNGVAGIRGTVYTLSADGVLTVLDGTVVLAYVGPDGNPVTKEIKAGQQYDAKTGQVTNISAEESKSMNQQAKALGVGRKVPVSVFAVDQTVFYVSPTQARGSRGGGTVESQPLASVR